ncbi:MAG TPA: anthranilate phosphoribosyltransferase [Gemmatimonadales bacterium]|jgi:anthranilate phosphoribosyltransferase|nr:anthranilate phosphoribosyltransferase [Gemmatimonadales bacterium]
MRASEVLEALSRRSLSREESSATFQRFVAGEYSEIEMAAVLAALKTRGESPEVMAGAVEALLAAALAFPRPDYGFGDCCGTGGDGAGTVNISTAAAFVAAELGIPMAKTGNRSVSSRCGSADVLERLGVKLDPAPEVGRRCLDQAGVCFVFAAQFHGGVRHAAPVRRALGVRTVFNLVGPIANAARPPWQLMGTYDPALCEPAARTLQLIGREVALVVHGSGLDEVALHGPTTGVLIRGGDLRHVTITPSDAGLVQAPLEALAGAGPEENGAWLVALLEGKGLPTHADAVALNAGALVWAIGKAPTLKDATRLAREALDGGGCIRRLTRLVDLSNGA